VPSTRSSRLTTAGLLALCAVPAAAGALRLTELATGVGSTPDAARFLASPVPVAVHIVGAVGFSVLGAFQFAPGFRRRWPGWHRAAGRVLVPLGLAAGLSGLWLTLFFPVPAHDRGLLEVFRIVFGLAMTVSVALGFRAVRRRDIAAHRAWMTRGYAIGVGAGTQALLFLPVTALGGDPDATVRALLMGAGWAVNLAVAEWLLRRGRRPAPRPVAARPVPTS
jgi:uncharacterized membrane protein